VAFFISVIFLDYRSHGSFLDIYILVFVWHCGSRTAGCLNISNFNSYSF